MTEKPAEPLIVNSNNDDDEVVIIPYVKPLPPLVILESDDEEELSKDLDKMRLTLLPPPKPLQPTGSTINEMSSSSSVSTKNPGAKDRTTQTKSNDLASTIIIFFFPKGRLRNNSVSEMLKFLTGLEKEYMVKIQPRTDETEGRGSISISGVSSAVSNARTQVQQWLKEKTGNVLNSDQNKENQYTEDADAYYDEEGQGQGLENVSEEEEEVVPVCMRTRKQQMQKRKDEAEKQEASLLIDLRLCRNVNEFELLMSRLRHVVLDLHVILKPRMEYNGLRVTIQADKMVSGQFPPPDRQQKEIAYAKTRLETWINMKLSTH